MLSTEVVEDELELELDVVGSEVVVEADDVGTVRVCEVDVAASDVELELLLPPACLFIRSGILTLMFSFASTLAASRERMKMNFILTRTKLTCR